MKQRHPQRFTDTKLPSMWICDENNAFTETLVSCSNNALYNYYKPLNSL